MAVTKEEPMRRRHSGSSGGKWLMITSFVLAAWWAASPSVWAVRVKDIAEVKGVRANQLVGYGLVVGLDGTGDGNKIPFTTQALTTMLEKLGLSVKAEDISLKNIAAVSVTAELPPFAKKGMRVDALVSSLGDAENLQGGTLLMAPLKAANGKVYVVAQGPVSTGGFQAKGQSGGGVQKNFPTVGRVVGGGIIEAELPAMFQDRQSLSLVLHNPDFTTATRITDAVNRMVDDRIAQTEDGGAVRIAVPQSYRKRPIEFIAMLEGLDVTPDVAAKVVINERTGTVVMGDNVRISTLAIAHGNLSIQIKERTNVSQPAPFARRGRTVASPESQVVVKEGNSRLFLVDSGTTIGEVVRALNALGVSPRDLIAIFQAIRAAGALQAELEII
jgi:flagellar P-ring protein precursor FlgI